MSESIYGEPLVSVVTPVYNGEAYLEECIESVLRQTYRNYEYIIVNNCSTDRTLEIAKKYADSDNRIRVYSNKQFVGVIDNHNTAFNLISPKARYCKVVSGDDFIFPNCLERMVCLAEANPSVGIVGSYQVSGTVVKWQGFRYPRAVMPGCEVSRRFLLGRQVFVEGQVALGFGSPTSLMYRADLVRSTKAFYPNASPHSDTSACFKSLQASDFGFVYEVLSYERTHQETQSWTSIQINRYLSATLNDLLEYGPFFLTKEEFKKQVKEAVKSYRRFLVVNYFARSQGKEFWDYHKGRLEELGYPLTRFALFKAAVVTVLEESVNPGLAIEKLRRRLSSAK
jgi:glycosyltransferase involved in cell wall biosynthesis